MGTGSARFGTASDMAGGHTKSLLAGAALLLLTGILYAPSLHYSYIFEEVWSTPPLQWRGLTTELAAFQPLHPARFVSNLSYRLTHAISLDPWADHAGNLAVHLLNTLLLIAAVAPLFGWDLALFCGAMFALHPLQQEAVIYIPSRPDLLVACGTLLALCGVTYRVGLLTLTGLVIAALSKETGLMAAPLAIFWAWRISRPIPWRWLALLGCIAVPLAVGHWWEFASVWLGSPRDWSLHLVMFWRLLSLVIVPVGFSLDHNFEWIGPVASCFAVVLLWIMANEYAEAAGSWLGFALTFAMLAILPRLLIRDPEPLHEHHLAMSMIGMSIGLPAWVSEKFA